MSELSENVLFSLELKYSEFCGRLNAGLKHSIDESDRKAALYAQTKADRQLNLTFPPVNAHHKTGNVNHGRQSYAFSGWSDSPVSTRVQ